MRKHGENSRLRLVSRLASLLVLVQSRRVLPTMCDLAQTYGVCERTIRRDLQAIEAAYVVPQTARAT